MSSLSKLFNTTGFILALQVPMIIWLVSALYVQGLIHRSNVNNAVADARSRAHFYQRNSVGERPSEGQMWNSIHQQMLIPTIGISAIGLVLLVRKGIRVRASYKPSTNPGPGRSFINRLCIYGIIVGAITLVASVGYSCYSLVSVTESRAQDRDYARAGVRRRGSIESTARYNRGQAAPYIVLFLGVGGGLFLVSGVGFLISRPKLPSVSNPERPDSPHPEYTSSLPK